MAIKSAASISTNDRQLQKIPTDNYIIFHHVENSSGGPLTIVIPVDPDSIQDSMSPSFSASYPLSRSAPIYSYQYSGPRNVQVSFTLHRDLCKEFNVDIDGDPVDDLVRYLDAIALPDYDSASKMVNPPIISLKIRDEIYIKGVVTGGVGLTYNLPLLNYNGSYKYALVSISFTVSEITPYSASILKNIGKYRN